MVLEDIYVCGRGGAGSELCADSVCATARTEATACDNDGACATVDVPGTHGVSAFWAAAGAARDSG